MAEDEGSLTVSDFCASLFHGPRADNTFKFLYGKDEERVADFFSQLFRHVVSAVDNDDAGRLGDFLQQAQADFYFFPPDKPPFWGPEAELEPVPLVRLSKPLSQTRLTLFTTGAFRLKDQPTFLPQGMSMEEAVREPMKAYERNPTLRVIPNDSDPGDLVVEHVAYDLSASVEDPNVMFPIQRLRELAQAGEIQLAENSYSYMGLSNLQRLRNEVARQWAEQLKAEGVEAVLLTPG